MKTRTILAGLGMIAGMALLQGGGLAQETGGASLEDLQSALQRQSEVQSQLRLREREVEVQADSAQPPRVLNFEPEMLQRLNIRPDQRFRTLTSQRKTPGGIVSALRLEDAQGLYAIAESIRDVPTLTPADRDGVTIDLVATGARTFVYETACKTVWNVPSRFSVGGEQVTLLPGESRELKVRDATYTLTLQTSQFVVEKPCSIHLEGGQSIIDYTLVRAG